MNAHQIPPHVEHIVRVLPLLVGVDPDAVAYGDPGDLPSESLNVGASENRSLQGNSDRRRRPVHGELGVAELRHASPSSCDGVV